jgi:hypothetical protein
VPIAAKQLWSLSSPRQVNQHTVKRAFQNACLSGQKASAGTAVLTLSKRGRGEEVAGKKKRRMNTVGCFNGLTSCMAKKLVRKRWLAKKAFKTKK